MVGEHPWPRPSEDCRRDRAQTAKLEQVIFAGFTHAPADRLARKLLAVAPAGLALAFYSDCGSTSVEVAVKMAVGYWHNVGQPRHRVVAIAHAYHGDTFGAMSVGARGVFTSPYQPMLFQVDFLPFPAPGKGSGRSKRSGPCSASRATRSRR